MAALLLAIIYAAFVSLGLPDPLLGAGWQSMRHELGVPLSYAGVLSMLIAGGSVISSLFAEKLTRRLGAGLMTALSVGLTAAAMLGFSLSHSFWALCVLALPYGLGAGGVDATLNNYVALHYSSRHMNLLHCFWGVGAAIGPYIMSYSLTGGAGWAGGYRSVAFLQIGLTVLLFVSLPLWKRNAAAPEDGGESAARPAVKFSEIFRIRGVVHVTAAFFAYCALESTVGLWASVYLIAERGIADETAARYASLFYTGITAGRFLSGFVSNKIGDKNMIRIGNAVLAAGIAAVWLPVKADWLCLNGLIVIGLGCAPIFPAIIHSTPGHFGQDKSQAIIGLQMACAYIGATFVPPLFGVSANAAGMWLYPAFMPAFAAIMFVMTERLNGIMKAR